MSNLNALQRAYLLDPEDRVVKQELARLLVRLGKRKVFRGSTKGRRKCLRELGFVQVEDGFVQLGTELSNRKVKSLLHKAGSPSPCPGPSHSLWGCGNPIYGVHLCRECWS